jgi:hypothetical protein
MAIVVVKNLGSSWPLTPTFSAKSGVKHCEKPTFFTTKKIVFPFFVLKSIARGAVDIEFDCARMCD